MIHVDRSRVQAPDVLTKPGRKGDVERKATLSFYSKKSNRGRSFGLYAAYKHEEVKRALKELFHDKCAFCEINYGGAPWAVEHFRPKGAMHELDLVTMRRSKGTAEVRPGYYWLAADWNNLLTSCTHCNSPNKHEFGDGSGGRTAGKSTFFPLETGSPRARDPDDGLLSNERPLLIDPTVDDPAAHLVFGDGGTIAELTERGRVTIGVLGLQRDPLVRRREEARVLLMHLIASAKSAKARVEKNPADAQARQDLSGHLAMIRTRYLADEAPFLAMSKQLVRQHLGREVAAPRPPVAQVRTQAVWRNPVT